MKEYYIKYIYTNNLQKKTTRNDSGKAGKKCVLPFQFDKASPSLIFLTFISV